MIVGDGRVIFSTGEDGLYIWTLPEFSIESTQTQIAQQNIVRQKYLNKNRKINNESKYY